MAEKKWRGIQMNHSLYQGEIIADPQIQGDYAFLTLRTVYTQRDANGQYTDIDVDIPLMVEPGGPLNVVTRFIKAGRKLAAWCHYKTWEANGAQQHAFVVKRFDLGDKPYEAPENQNVPPLPG